MTLMVAGLIFGPRRQISKANFRIFLGRWIITLSEMLDLDTNPSNFVFTNFGLACGAIDQVSVRYPISIGGGILLCFRGFIGAHRAGFYGNKIFQNTFSGKYVFRVLSKVQIIDAQPTRKILKQRL